MPIVQETMDKLLALEAKSKTLEAEKTAVNDSISATIASLSQLNIDTDDSILSEKYRQLSHESEPLRKCLVSKAGIYHPLNLMLVWMMTTKAAITLPYRREDFTSEFRITWEYGLKENNTRHSIAWNMFTNFDKCSDDISFDLKTHTLFTRRYELQFGALEKTNCNKDLLHSFFDAIEELMWLAANFQAIEKEHKRFSDSLASYKHYSFQSIEDLQSYFLSYVKTSGRSYFDSKDIAKLMLFIKILQDKQAEQLALTTAMAEWRTRVLAFEAKLNGILAPYKMLNEIADKKNQRMF